MKIQYWRNGGVDGRADSMRLETDAETYSELLSNQNFP